MATDVVVIDGKTYVKVTKPDQHEADQLEEVIVENNLPYHCPKDDDVVLIGPLDTETAIQIKLSIRNE